MASRRLITKKELEKMATMDALPLNAVRVRLWLHCQS